MPDDGRLRRVLDALVAGGRAGEVAGIVSGYLASPAQARAVAPLVESVKAARPDALYLCDPVIGDSRPGRRRALCRRGRSQTAMRDELLPLADIATPNAFECGWLSGSTQRSQARSRRAGAEPAAARGARHVGAGDDARAYRQPARGGRDRILFEHPLLKTPAKGTGDLLAALLLARRLQGQSLPKAAETALASIFEIVAGTAKAGAEELLLAASRSRSSAPHASVVARRLGPGAPR